ncbi:MAG TPA: T9SS type A sorting domain-containing protein [Flavobacteriales bacterium]|mgnify:CR=1 FL=1|nr:T9SS type A sorting domain-containing protein [Flavobacteriales bacterium]HRE95169.1 T9SS type A sorting domain-containing protein [Flavobacteriales bacterium]HRJ39418.1 T9SS type A sorting domain-containing protein [Flavobacteriales bacterium]
MRLLFLFLFSFCSIILFSQTGPGGIGSLTDNALWLRANSGTSTTTAGTAVQTWNDMSGNGNNVSQATVNQRPIFRTNIMNGYPAIQFDNVNTAGNNDFMEGADSPTLDNTNGLTIITVIRMTNLGDARSIVAKRTNVGVNQAYMFFLYTSNYLFIDVASNDNRFSTNPTAYAINTNYMLSLLYDGSLSAPNRCKVYDAQALRVTSTESAATLPDYASPLIIGATHVGDNRPFGGYIAEIIIFRRALNDTERVIVDNYLSSKYNIALSGNDYHSMDTPANGDFDHEVAGIGRRIPAEFHNDAQGTSIVRINNPSALSNNEYLFWGHDNGTMTTNNTVDVDGTIIQSRLNRIWRLTETGDVGTVTVSFDVSGFTSVTGSDLRLLIDRDGDGFFDNDIAPQSGSFAGNIITFTNVDFTSGDRFTLGSINLNQTPLPVELLDFHASRNEGVVQLGWETATESNSSHFVVQRSVDGIQWIGIGQIMAAGFSVLHRNYNFTDHAPLSCTSYYRLRMVDLDGSNDFSSVRVVDAASENSHWINVFPNPVSDWITLKSIDDKPISGIEIYDVAGRKVREVAHSVGASLTIDVSDLPPGTYYFVYNQGSRPGVSPFVRYQ